MALTGLVSADSTTMSGTYLTTVTTCGVPEMGTWTGTAVPPLSGSFTATFTSTEGGGTTMAAGMISQGANPTGGTVRSADGQLYFYDFALPASGWQRGLADFDRNY